MRRGLSVALLFITLLAAAACNRLEPPSLDPGLDFSDPDVGGGVGMESGPQTPIPLASPTKEASPRLDAAAAALATFPPATPTPLDTPAPPATEAAAPVETPPPTAEATATPESAGEIIHTVQPGETLFQIDLRYGLSWVAIAEFNGLANADALSVGQELRIPPTPTPTAEARAAAPVVAGLPDGPVD